MKIIAHRGAWNTPPYSQEPNSLKAFTQAIASGFGIEVDIRDYHGKLVVSHNPAQENSPLLSSVLEVYKKFHSRTCIAFNIKADGLQSLLQTHLMHYDIKHYFTFDMSIPNTMADAESKLQFFLRQSEFELCPQKLGFLYQHCKGVWIDQFEQDNTVLDHNFQSLSEHLKNHKYICWVSPELHLWGKNGKYYLEIWKSLKRILNTLENDNVYLCTDYPHEAKEYFNGKY